jgi:shikimate dehydrogenase
MRYCLIGKNIGYSLSPLIHRIYFEHEGVKGEYILHDCDTLPGFMADGSYDGINITTPYKIEAIKRLTALDANAARSGAVNCVYKGMGYNTDYEAFRKILGEEILPSFDGNDRFGGGEGAGKKYGRQSKQNSALILGIGGAARAIALALLDKSIEITFAVRQSYRDFGLTGEFEKIKIVDIASVDGSYGLIVNATPYGRDLSLPPLIDKKTVLKCGYVFDAVYQDTTLLSLARESNKPYSNGLRMLLLQAYYSHKIWDLSYKKIDLLSTLERMKDYI